MLRKMSNAAVAVPSEAISEIPDQFPLVSPWLKKTPSQNLTTLKGLIGKDSSMKLVVLAHVAAAMTENQPPVILGHEFIEKASWILRRRNLQSTTL